MKKNNDSQSKNTTGTTKKKSDAVLAAKGGASATDKVKARSSSDVNGASGTRNTGTNVSYQDQE